MTKLTEWLFAAATILGPWSAVLFDVVKTDFTEAYYVPILLFPILLIALFGIASLSIIAYRVYTFNDCEEAAKEMQLQILQAKEELSKKGMKFDS